MFFIAFADAADNSNATLFTVLVSMLILAGVAVVAVVPPLVLRRQRHAAAGPLGMLAFLWALGAGGLGLYSFFERQRWNQETLILIQSGYYDPSTAVPPSLHLLVWLGLAVGYGLLMAAAIGLTRRSPAPRE